MALTLDQIRKRMEEQEKKKAGENTGFQKDNASYHFWDIPENSKATLRFLPDGNPDNAYFWVERSVIRLPFSGILGMTTDKEVVVQIPCMHNYGEKDPVIEATKPWWKEDDMKDLARVYYKKVSYLFQGFVVDSPLEEKDVPENPIRRFVVGKEIHGKIYASIKDPEMLHAPTDYDNGADFKISKTKKGQYASYDTSGFSRNNRALSQAERDALEKYPLQNLADFLPKKPDEEHLQAIVEMFEASVAGLPYDPAKWSKFYKPAQLHNKGDNSGEGSSTATTTKETLARTMNAEVEEEKVVETPTVTTLAPPRTESTVVKKSPAELLADLKRNAGKK